MTATDPFAQMDAHVFERCWLDPLVSYVREHGRGPSQPPVACLSPLAQDTSDFFHLRLADVRHVRERGSLPATTAERIWRDYQDCGIFGKAAYIAVFSQLPKVEKDHQAQTEAAAFPCSKAELLRALGKDRTHTNYLEQLIDSGALELTKATKPVGTARYFARFTDATEHDRVIDAIKADRG